MWISTPRERATAAADRASPRFSRPSLMSTMRRWAAAPERTDRHLDGPADIGARAVNLSGDLMHRLACVAHQGFDCGIGAEYDQPDARRRFACAIDEIERLRDGLPADAAREIEREHHVGMPRGGAGERSGEREHQRGEGERPQSRRRVPCLTRPLRRTVETTTSSTGPRGATSHPGCANSGIASRLPVQTHHSSASSSKRKRQQVGQSGTSACAPSPARPALPRLRSPAASRSFSRIPARRRGSPQRIASHRPRS